MQDKNNTLTDNREQAQKYTITFDANGNNITAPKPIEEYEGRNAVLEKVTSDTATFVGWSENPSDTIGKLNHIAQKDTTLYAIATSGPVYVVDTYYRGDPNNYKGARNSFRRYVIDVYLENAVATSGSFKLNTDNKFLYYLGNVPQDGISSTVDAPVIRGESGTPGLQYFTTPSIEYKWTSDSPVDASNGRIRVARIMMYFSSWGMGYNQIEMRTTDEIVSPFKGYTALVDGESAYVTASFYKGVKSDEVKISGKVTLEGKEDAECDKLKLYILDKAGDAVDFKVLGSCDGGRRTFSFDSEIIPGNYTVKVMKNGYLTRLVPLSVTDGGEIPEIVMLANGTSDERVSCDGIPLKKVIDKANYKIDDWNISVFGGVPEVTGGSEKAIANAVSFIENEYAADGKYLIPSNINHTRDYDLATITVGKVSIGKYKIVYAQSDEIASEYARYIYDYIAEISGYGLETVTDAEPQSEYEILVGATNRRESPITEAEKYKVYEDNGKFYVFYGDEQSAEMACLDLCRRILGKKSEGYDGVANVKVKSGASFEGEWSVLARFGVMSDSHIGERYNWPNYDWLYNTFDNFKKIHNENPLDFIVSLGDNIDDGYTNTYAPDYAEYLEKIKKLDICDPVNPIDGREYGKIPHYEICGNHDPIAGQLDENGNPKIRFIKNGLWYTENEKGEKAAHIAFFSYYGGYPLYEYTHAGTYESYLSYGKVDDAMVKFVEESIIKANAEGAKHIILYNHWGMSQQVGSPMLPESGLGKIASVCEKFGIKLYFNGHEHDTPYTLRRYNEIYDYDVSMTSRKHAVVEITSLRAKVTIYYSENNTIYREDIVPLSGRGEAKQKLVQ